MKKTKRTLLLATAISCFLLAFAGGCAQGTTNSSPDSSFDSRWAVIEGYEVAESITVDEKEMVNVPIPIVTDGAGNVLDVYYEVMTKDGGYVGTTADKFFALDAQGYQIRYVVVGKDGATHEKITEVAVKSDLTLELSATYDIFVEQGVEVKIAPVCNMENPTFAYSVINKATQTAVDVSADGSYVCTELGWHTVTIEATSAGKTVSYDYEIYCRAPMQEGEVEVFDENWETIRLLQNYGTYDAKYTNTAESGVKDRFGLDSDFLMLKTSNFIEYANLYINPRGSEEYYRQLAAEGYTHVSFWIYSESSIPHDVMLQLVPTKGLYTFDIGAVLPNKWVEMKVNLVEDKAYYESCFAAAVDYFKKQETPILQFDNTNGWNGPNGSYGYESDMTFYISDVYAVKPSGIEKNMEAVMQYRTGETVDVSSLFTLPEGVEVGYAVTYNGETVPTTGNYTFKANGTYEISVIAPKNLSCEQTATVTVVDNVTASVTSIEKERIGEELTIDVSNLGVTFILESETLTPTSYKVTLDGEAISVENNQFTASKDGGYVVEYEIPYTVEGIEYISYVEVKIDVWSQNSKYLVSDVAHMFASSEYCGASNWDTQPTYEVGEYTVGEKTGNMLKISKMGEALLVPFKPVYTKAYYEGILSEMPEAKVVVSYYVTPQESGISARCYADGYSGGSPIFDKWNTSVIPLADFIEDYDNISEGYDEIKYLKDNDIKQTHSRNENDYLLWMTGAGHLNKVTVYVADIYITDKVEVENDGGWNDLANADAVSTTINPWTSAQATRNGLVDTAEIVSIGGESQAAYTKVTVGAGFFCYGGYQIKPSMTIKDAWQSYADKDIVFDWYYDVVGDTENQYNYNVSVYGKSEVAYTQNTWHTSRISMADLLADWDDVIAGSNNGGDSSPWTPWIKFKYTTAQHAEQAGVVYLGNLRFEDHVDDGTGGEEGGNEEETPKFWNDLSSTDAIKTTMNRWSQTIPAIPTTSEMQAIGGVDGASYIRIDGDTGFFMYAGYKILPTGTKADYEQYAGLTLVFDWYYSIPNQDANYAVSVYGVADAQFAEETWHTVTIAIDDLLAEWDNLIDESNPMSKGTAWLDFNWIGGQADAAGVLYIGNIRLGGEAPEKPDTPVIPEPPEIIIDEVTVSETQRYESSTEAVIDFVAMYTANGGATDLSMYVLTAKLVPEEGETITFNNPTSVSVSALATGTYTATLLTSDEELVMTVTIEIYTEAQVEIEVNEITVSEIKLVEITETTTLNLTAMYTENGGTTDLAGLSVGLLAEITSPYGNTTVVEEVNEIEAASLSKGVHTIHLKTTNNISVMTVTVDVYAAADGLVWQDIQQDTVHMARVWKYGYLNVGEATYSTIDGVSVLQFTTQKAGEANANQIGLRLQALHSKEYYTLMSEKYEAVTFDVYASNGGLNIKTCEDTSANGGWHGNNTWKTYTVSLQYLLANWNTLNDLTNTNDTGASVTQLITTFWGEDNQHIVSIGKFGCVARATVDPETPEETLPVWNDFASSDSLRTNNNRYSHSVPSVATESELTAVNAAKNSGYFKIVALADQFDYAGYLVIPSGEKAVYENYATGYNLVFDWYFDLTDDTAGLTTKVSVYGGEVKQYAQDTWHTESISMAALLAEWDALNTYGWNSMSGTPWLQFKYSNLKAGTVYIGNIRLVAVDTEQPEQPEPELPEETLPIWNDMSQASALTTTVNPWTASQATRNGLVSASKVAELGGVSGAAYTSVSLGEGFLCYGGYQIVPTNTDKAAWEAYADYNIVFDWYYDVTGDTENQYNYNVSVYGGANAEFAQDRWHTSRISMADILADWADVIAGSNNKGDSSPWTPWIKFKQTSADHEAQSGIVYIGNIRLEKAGN